MRVKTRSTSSLRQRRPIALPKLTVETKETKKEHVVIPDWAIVVTILCIRLVLAWVVRTAFNPDEFWQCPEVAHRLVFGRGEITWEWRDGAQIRSYLHVFVCAGPFWVLKYVGLDNPWVVAGAPRAMHALLLGLTDLAAWRLGVRFGGDRVGLVSVVVGLVSWFIGFAGVRSFSNVLEAFLVGWALAQWPWWGVRRGEYSGYVVGLFWAWLAVCVRPTAALAFVVPGIVVLVRTRKLGGRWEALKVLLVAVVSGMAVLGGGCWLDSYMIWWTNGGVGEMEMVCPSVEFVRLNVGLGLDKIYGAVPWHWYFSSGIAMVGSSLFVAVASVLVLSREELGKPTAPTAGLRELAWTIGVVLVGLSIASHKEPRFMLPLMLPISVLTAILLGLIPAKQSTAIYRISRGYFVLNLLVFLFVSLVHQRAPIAATEWIRDQADLWTKTTHEKYFSWSHAPKDMSVHVWADCHTIPAHAMVHRSVPLIHLDCSPGWRAIDSTIRHDAAGRFMTQPLEFLQQEMYNLNSPSIPSPSTFTVSTHPSAWNTPSQGAFIGSPPFDPLPSPYPKVQGITSKLDLPTHIVADSTILCRPEVSEFTDSLSYKMDAWSYFETDPFSLSAILQLTKAYSNPNTQNPCHLQNQHNIRSLIFLTHSKWLSDPTKTTPTFRP